MVYFPQKLHSRTPEKQHQCHRTYHAWVPVARKNIYSKKSDKPVFGIVGSSNLTANAFGVSNKLPNQLTDSPNPPRKFNYECDVLMWDEKNTQISNVIAEFTNNPELNNQIIVTRYAPEDNHGLTINERLEELEKQIRDAGNLRPLFEV